MSTDSPAVRPPRSSRDHLVDLTFIGTVLFIGLVVYVDNLETHVSSDLVVGLDLAAGGLSAIALWWRRQWPVQIALATAAVSAFSQITSIAAVIMLFTVAVHRSTRTLAPVALVNLAATCTLVIWQPDPMSSVPVDISINVLILVALLAWGMYIRARRQLLHSLQERAERAEAEQHWRFDQGRQLERTRIAREMHDVLGHRISLISMHAGALELRAGTAGDDVAESAAIIRASAHQALQDLREVIGVLRTDPEDDPVSERPQPTLEQVPALVEESRQAGMNITLHYDVTATEEGAPASMGRTAYRIVQEGLTNARKHAAGAAVLVQVSGKPGPGLTVDVRTRKPIRPATEAEPSSGQGLLGLAERAELIGGRFEHSLTPEGDFLMRCWLPWSAWRIPERPQPLL
jgi:signal transduction histidine kinase